MRSVLVTCASSTCTLTQSYSTAATSYSLLEAKESVKQQRARNISCSWPNNAFVPETSHPTPPPTFQQLHPKTNVPNPALARPTHRDTPLDHSFISMPGDLFYGHRRVLVNPELELIANAMEVHTIRASRASELREKVKKFLEYDGNKLIHLEYIVKTNEYVYPMVHPGKALDEQVLHPVLKDKKLS